MDSHGTSVRVGYLLLALMEEARRMQRLIRASGGDVDHAARVYEVVSAVRLAERERRRRSLAA